MEEILETEKEFIFDKVVKLKNFIFTSKASRSIDLDTSWTQKAVKEGIIQHIGLNGSLFFEKSQAVGHEEDIIYLIKPFINDFYRWIAFRFAQDEDENDVAVVVISAHKDKKIYGEERG